MNTNNPIATESNDDGVDIPEMVLIPPGEFLMGGRLNNNERPIHRVVIARPFELGKYPVTYKEFLRFVQATSYPHKPSPYKSFDFASSRSPAVHEVNWEDAKAYCMWLAVQIVELATRDT